MSLEPALEHFVLVVVQTLAKYRVTFGLFASLKNALHYRVVQKTCSSSYVFSNSFCN